MDPETRAFLADGGPEYRDPSVHSKPRCKRK
jgi:hypothetical protein